MKYLLCASLLFFLLDCAVPASAERMTVTDFQVNKPVGERIFVVESTGGSMTLPFWISNIPNDNFTDAVRTSLVQSKSFQKISDSMENGWILKIEIIDLDRPWFGTDFKHKLTARYTLTKNGKIIFNEPVTAEGTATMGDALIGVYRAKKANEFAARNSIKAFLNALNDLNAGIQLQQ
ncbi:MAG TPA: hypothetical protein PL048_10310 [Leptospiraceae bacterium]|nr:hypothetical protein [Leptospiraceae bacterium]HMY66313.1 hypothetical protein [Leptospiraceae bacterium]HMZ59159.1 hypothetical protein [Leptospiraceae bacterium]HNF13643.1 hypothetical protein [Leptospiraceae bacterium]HNF22950.1 hypothetical protein [Leptospiraceae bacterium]